MDNITDRQKLRNKRVEIFDKIALLKKEDIELQKELCLLCDDKQWFTEQEETHGRGKKKETHLYGRINWNEFFQDYTLPEGEGVWITRSRITRIDGVWRI